MAQKKFDGLVEVVRYLPSGSIDMVRVYERRGPTYTDRILLDRQTLLARLKDGKKFVTGRRIDFMSSSFEVDAPIRLIHTAGGDIIASGDASAEKDNLQGTPLF